MGNNLNLDRDEIRTFYNWIKDIWAPNDPWHLYSKYKIESFLKKVKFTKESYILNAGSGGNDYNLKCKQNHVDIADKKISHLELHTVASIEDLPFSKDCFDGVICVGSVINYCDALKVISEFSRVLKNGGILILEFENSWAYEYRNKAIYKSNADIIQVTFQNQKHTQWIYSHLYIQKLINQYDFKILKKYHFHIFSSYLLSKGFSELYASKYCRYDQILQWLPLINNHAGNIIFICKKL